MVTARNKTVSLRFLPAGTRLAKWIASGDSSPRQHYWAKRIYRWKGWWFDLNWQQQLKLSPPCVVGDPPGANLLFVMGFWRSGTTLLHELLAAGPHMAAPQTWQCMNPSAFRLINPPQCDDGGVQRPMDSVIISLHSPQEDEFSLLANGAPSVYRAWIDPRRWEETLPALSQQTWLDLPEKQWLTDWKDFLGWCMPADAHTLVVKSPNHVFRLKAIHRAWPTARFIWTLRDPVDTWLSNRKMWQAMVNMYALWEWRLEDLDQLLFHAFREYVHTLRWAMEAFGSEQMAVVGFDQLTERSPETLCKIICEMGLGRWDEWQPLVQPRLDLAARYSREICTASTPLPEYGLKLIEEIRKLHSDIIEPQKCQTQV